MMHNVRATAWIYGIFELQALRGASLQSTMYSTPILLQSLSGIQRREIHFMKWCIFLVIIFPKLLIAQSSNEDLAWQKLRSFYLTHSTNPHPEIYYNKTNHTLDLGRILPLMDLDIEYLYHDTLNLVMFKCPYSNDMDVANCLKEIAQNGDIQWHSGWGEIFKTKDDCYTFISLLADLKASIKN